MDKANTDLQNKMEKQRIEKAKKEKAEKENGGEEKGGSESEEKPIVFTDPNQMSDEDNSDDF